MINISLREYDKAKPIQKNILYKVNNTCSIPFVEQHEGNKEVANTQYILEDGQYGIYANEYRAPNTEKRGCKTTDVLACVVDTNIKEINSLIFDVKSNISAFSDDLSKDGAMMTAIKEVRDFIEQVHAELLHKESFMLYYKDAAYNERENVGIVTKNFEPKKFVAVAERLEKLIAEQEKSIPPLILYKTKNNINAYKGEIESLYNFAQQKIAIKGKLYQMQVFLLDKLNATDYQTTIQLAG